jgi:hypothetical chaperone protein
VIYAIDFGTTNSLLCAAGDGQVSAPIPLDPAAAQQGKDPSILRSILYFSPGERKALLGEEGRRAYLENGFEGRLLRSFKRFLPNSSFSGTQVAGRTWKLEELIALFLREIRERANRHFDRDVDSVVLGRPARFSEEDSSDSLAQTRLENAARAAGFNHIEFLPEPTAAAYRFRMDMQREETALVADFGGGTSDFTVLRLRRNDNGGRDGAMRPDDVLAVGGVPLAGDALDGNVMRHRVSKHFGADVKYQAPFGSNTLTMPKGLMANLCSTAHIQLLTSRENSEFFRSVTQWALGEGDRLAMDRLRTLLDNQLGFAVFEAIEGGKRALSDAETGEIRFDYPDVDLRETVTRAEYRDYVSDTVAQVFASLDETLARSGLKASDIDRVCCTGGTARAFPVQEELRKRFGAEKLEGYRHFSSVVEGLGQRALQLT